MPGYGGGSSTRSSGGYGATGRGSSKQEDKASALQQHQVALAQALARLNANKKTRGQAKEILKAYGPDIPKEVLAKYGLKVPNKGVVESIVGRANQNPAGHALLKALDLSGRLGKETLAIVRGVKEGDSFGDIHHAAGLALQKGEGPASLGEALGKTNPGGAKGVAYAGANFVGTAIFDPLSYLSAGTSKAAKSALETIAKEAGEDAAKQLAKNGLKNFGETRAKQILLKAANAQGREIRGGAEKAVEKQLAQLAKSGRGGVRFAGKTVIPGHVLSEPLSRVTEAATGRIGATKAGAAGLEALSSARGGLGRRLEVGYDIGKAQGTGIRDTYRSFLSKARAQADLSTKGTADRLTTLVKDSGATKSEIRDKLGNALETLDRRSLPAHLRPLYDEVVANVKDIPKLLEDNPNNPLRAVLGHVHGVNQQLAWADGFKALSSEVDDLGHPIVARTAKEFSHVGARDAAKPMAIKVGGEKFFVRQEIGKDFKALMEPATLNGFQKVAFKVQSIWKPYATIIRPGFNVRNAESNILMNFLAGVRNPKFYTDAVSVQRGKATGYLAKVKDWALQDGIIDSGFFVGDVAKDYSAVSRALEGGSESIAGKVGRQFLPEGKVLGTGQKVASAVEGNARLAHYIWALDQGMTREQAARSVKKYLFDYGELTPFEQRVLKPGIAFYTYARKITPLMTAELAKHPGILSAQAHLRDTFNEGNEPGGSATPDWMLGQGQFFTGGPLKSLLAPGTKNPVVTGLDTPLNAAFNTVEPLLQVGSAVLPGKQGFEPESAADVYRSLANIPSGGVVEGIKTGIERATGVDLYTGGKIHEKAWLSFAKDALPIIDSVQRIKDGNTKLEAIKFLLGANTFELTEGRQSSATYSRLLKAKALLERKKVPTLKELQDAGLIQQNSGSSTSGKSRSSGKSGGYGQR